MMKRAYEVDHWMEGRAVSRARVTIEGDARLVVVLSRDLKELQMSEYSVKELRGIPTEVAKTLHDYTTWLFSVEILELKNILAPQKDEGEETPFEECVDYMVDMYLDTVGGDKLA